MGWWVTPKLNRVGHAFVAVVVVVVANGAVVVGVVEVDAEIEVVAPDTVDDVYSFSSWSRNCWF